MPGQPGYFPPLICPTRTGLQVFISIPSLDTEYESAESSNTVEWDGGNSILSTVCFYGTGCGGGFSSLMPVKTGRTTGEGDPALRGRLVALYAHVEYVCGGEPGSGSPGEPPGPDNGGPYWDAKIVGLGPDAGGGNAVALVAHSTEKNGSGDTYLAAERSCTLSGYAIENASTAFGLNTTLDGYYSVGKNGNMTTGAECAQADCATSCTSTGLSVDFVGGPLDGVSLDADGGENCGYAIDNGRYHGEIGLSSFAILENSSLPAFRLRIFDRDNGDALVLTYFLTCDGQTDPAIGTYANDPIDPSETVYASVG